MLNRHQAVSGKSGARSGSTSVTAPIPEYVRCWWEYSELAALNGRDFMNKLLLWFALVALVVGLALSAIFNIAVCMWGCPQTMKVDSMQASFFVLVGLIVWVVYKLFSKHPYTRNRTRSFELQRLDSWLQRSRRLRIRYERRADIHQRSCRLLARSPVGGMSRGDAKRS